MVNNRISKDCILPASSTNTTSGTGTGLGTLLAAVFTTSKVYKSTDNGDTWDTGVVVGTAGAGVACVTRLTNGWLLAAGFFSGKAYKSVDDGVTWDAGVAGGATGVLGITQLADGSVVASGYLNGKVYKSTDLGATWDAGVIVVAGIVQITQLTDGSIVVVNYSTGKIYKSTDLGATWDAGVTVGASIRGVCQLPNGDVLCSGANKLYRSTDLGATWDVGTAFTGLDNCLYYDDGFVYASSQTPSTSMRRSADNGTTWGLVGTAGVPFYGVSSIPPLAPSTASVPAGASGVVLQCSSTTGESYWRINSTASGGFRLRSSDKPTVLRFDPSQAKTLYLWGSVNYMFIA